MKTIETVEPEGIFTAEMLTTLCEHKIVNTTTAVYLYLILNVDDYETGRIVPLDVKDIAKKLGMSDGSVYKALSKLDKAGLYIREKQKGIYFSLPLNIDC